MHRALLTVAACAAWVACGSAPGPAERPVSARPPTPAATDDRIALAIDTGEADAVLAMIGARDRDAAWRSVVASDGFRLLEQRELSMKRTFDHGEFRTFVDTLGPRLSALRAAVDRWRTFDVVAIGARVVPYLPAEAKLVATVYPVIKPRENSFVYLGDAAPAIFMFVDPGVSSGELQNTIAHELHHIGYASLASADCTAPAATCRARVWASALGEGFAILAAAGGPEVHPHHTSKPDVRARWDRDIARVDDQLRAVESFLRDVAAGELDEAAARERGMTFFGVQGPWYTVGWTIAVAIERCAGRAALVEAMRRPWTTLGLYNAARARCPGATGGATATWDPELVRVLEAG